MADDPKKAADEAAAAAKAKADADAAAAAGKKDGHSDANDDGGELAKVFADDKDKGTETPDAKGGGDLKLSVPDDLKDLVGEGADYVTAAREAKLTQQQFDKVMGVQFDRVKAAAQEAQEESERITLEWQRELKSDPTLGGANLKQSIATAERGARALGGSALAVKLAKHMRGEEVIDGPTLIRAFHMAGLAESEDRLGEPGQSETKDPTASMTKEQRRMYKRYGAPGKDGARQ